MNRRAHYNNREGSGRLNHPSGKVETTVSIEFRGKQRSEQKQPRVVSECVPLFFRISSICNAEQKTGPWITGSRPLGKRRSADRNIVRGPGRTASTDGNSLSAVPAAAPTPDALVRCSTVHREARRVSPRRLCRLAEEAGVLQEAGKAEDGAGESHARRG